MPRAAIVALSVVMLALVAIIVYAGRHEATQRASATVVISNVAARQQPAPLTAEEEAFATALWPMHSEVVEPSAVRLTFAGMIYTTEDHDAKKLAATLGPVNATFRAAVDKARTMDVPASMQAVHDLYVTSLDLYVKASTEMLKLAQDGNERHLVDAQAISKLASEDLLKAGDVLWPGEHKPN